MKKHIPPELAAPVTCWLVVFIISTGMVIASFVLQYFVALTPCSLCIFSRVAVMGLSVICFIALLTSRHSRGWQQCWAIVAFVCTAFGAMVSIRHSWLLTLPPEQVPSCGPGLNYLINTLPWHEAFAMVLTGSGECAKARDLILGVPLAHWTLLGFIGLVALNALLIYLLAKAKKANKK